MVNIIFNRCFDQYLHYFLGGFCEREKLVMRKTFNIIMSRWVKPNIHWHWQWMKDFSEIGLVCCLFRSISEIDIGQSTSVFLAYIVAQTCSPLFNYWSVAVQRVSIPTYFMMCFRLFAHVTYLFNSHPIREWELCLWIMFMFALSI